MDSGRPSVTETLDRARDRGFVGRRAELDAVAASLEGSSDARVHLVNGPGGIGKSTLLDACGRAATRRGFSVDLRRLVRARWGTVDGPVEVHRLRDQPDHGYAGIVLAALRRPTTVR